MSVINKMLRDLDRRQADTSALGALGIERTDSDTRLPVVEGLAAAGSGKLLTAAARPARTADKRRVVIWAMVVLGLSLVTLLAGFWWMQRPPKQALALAGAPKAVVDEPVAVSVAESTSAPVNVAVQPTVAVSEPDMVVLPVTPSVLPKPVPTPAAVVVVPTKPVLPVAPAQPLNGNLTLKLSAGQLQVPVPVPVRTLARMEPPLKSSTPAPAAAAQAVTQPSAPRELVAQAQVLWAAGDQSAALLLLKGALARVESAPTGAKHDTADVAVLAREYASEALASGQTSEVLATLERLEPRLAGVADIWAIRGNAAQRLGRHAQAVAAYQQALALNPNEPRWLLGAAVSLAAMGQTLAATDMAEKVRVARALPPDVANYLRQLGVVIRPD